MLRNLEKIFAITQIIVFYRHFASETAEQSILKIKQCAYYILNVHMCNIVR